MSGVDLSGEWSGMYHYRGGPRSNMFTASIRDSGGVVAGLIDEPDEAGRGPRQAVIDGSHDGSTLRFVKTYDDIHLAPVHYRGTIRAEGEEVEGEWTIPPGLSGTFFMVRAPRSEAAVEQVAEAPVS